ncbi:hypothetical protein AA983_14105 [Dermacoccus sp. PE3]|uniref:VOC family protein n=1 Tax=unclassified Dermacoccus TaxID=2643059 RepID=UPI0006419CC3|nr:MULTISPECIES: VOC family protein [unclassified Dermacoccus]KLO61785.1 hypothetical protein AA983_14105 [Dermacoccus sp. PE3]
MTTTETTSHPDVDCSPQFNHIAIQTDDVEGTTLWYENYLGATVQWSMDTFSDLTTARLPGISHLVEVKAGNLRLHVFDRQGNDLAAPQDLQRRFQHLGATVERAEHLTYLRERWFEVRDTGDYRWVRDDEPSEIVVDSQGMQSLYVFDPNGLEFEFVYFPETPQ